MEPLQTSESGSLSGTKPKRQSKKTTTDKLAEHLINTVIADSLTAKAQEKNRHMYKEKCASAVINTVDEFLRSYILVGYDFDGTPIKIIQAHSGMEADALKTSMEEFMFNLHGGDDFDLD